MIEHEDFHTMQISHCRKVTCSCFGSRLPLLSFHTANKHSNQSQRLCRTTTSNNNGWRAHYLSLSAKHCLTNQMQTIKNLQDNIWRSITKQFGYFYRCCSVLSDEALASVKKPRTVAPPSNNTSRTSCGTVSALLGWGILWKAVCKFVFPWSWRKRVLRSARGVMIWAILHLNMLHFCVVYSLRTCCIKTSMDRLALSECPDND